MSGTDDTRAFLLGGVFDFVLHMVKRDPPIIVGNGYPRDSFITEFETWATGRGLKLDRIEMEKFRKACELKMLG
jgi:hypothetical protein